MALGFGLARQPQGQEASAFAEAFVLELKPYLRGTRAQGALGAFASDIENPESEARRQKPLLRYFHEDDHEREQHQRLDECKAQNQGHLNARASRRIASQRFAG